MLSNMVVSLFCIQIDLMSQLGIFKNTEINCLFVYTDTRLPFFRSLIPADPLITTGVCLEFFFLVVCILLLSNITKIINSVVMTNIIDMVNLAFGKFSMNNSPNKSMRLIDFFHVSNLDIPMNIQTISKFFITIAEQFSSFWKIGKRFTQPFEIKIIHA